jgi:hypothetical protein
MEQLAVVRVLTLKKLSAKNIIAELKGVYEYEALSLAAVKNWRKRSANQRMTLEDDTRSERSPRSDPYEFLCAMIDETSFI